jgi:hypothetical protein
VLAPESYIRTIADPSVKLFLEFLCWECDREFAVRCTAEVQPESIEYLYPHDV